ncbi:MAG: sigma 54-interacting transcriptional regulator [Spirochaetales bacterium]|nr:sigma 54-interacting transcriptional regulator [Spirochaetales bacterium]
MIEILVIVPSEELYETFDRELNRITINGVNFTTTYIYGTDDAKIDMVKSYDIVVVRGMTAHAVTKRFPDITKIDIPMSSSDILDALLKVKRNNDGGKIGLILSDASICPIDTILELTGMDIVLKQVNDEQKLSSTITELMQLGCTTFVGGYTLKHYCDSNNIKAFSISTGKEAIRKSIAEALNAASIINRERTRVSMMQTILDTTNNAMFVINTFKTIINANKTADNFFGQKITGKNINDLISFGSIFEQITGQFEVVQSIHGEMVYVQINPFDIDGEGSGFLITIRKIDEIEKTEKFVRTKLANKGLTARYHFSDIIAQSLVMRQIIAKAIRYASVDGNILLTGETGTGKELFVQSMHNASSRCSGPFVAINCAALSEQLLESELFGYSEGAFTGARKGGKKGLVELAHEGTLFLDEIGELPIQLQAKLLRVLQEKQVRRVGGDEVIPVDVRIMSATNQNIPALIEKGLFRRDLYYRINLLTLHIPPLRERVGDVRLLFSHYVNLYANKMKIAVPSIEESAYKELDQYSFPGNIRELRNISERIVILNGSKNITNNTIYETDVFEDNKKIVNEVIVPEINYKKLNDEELYKKYLESGMSIAEFISLTGISRTTLWRKFRKYETF